MPETQVVSASISVSLKRALEAKVRKTPNQNISSVLNALIRDYVNEGALEATSLYKMQQELALAQESYNIALERYDNSVQKVMLDNVDNNNTLCKELLKRGIIAMLSSNKKVITGSMMIAQIVLELKVPDNHIVADNLASNMIFTISPSSVTKALQAFGNDENELVRNFMDGTETWVNLLQNLDQASTSVKTTLKASDRPA